MAQFITLQEASFKISMLMINSLFQLWNRNTPTYLVVFQYQNGDNLITTLMVLEYQLGLRVELAGSQLQNEYSDNTNTYNMPTENKLFEDFYPQS